MRLLEREADLDRIAGFLRGLPAGRGGVALVYGPPGIGKTRLVADALAAAGGLAVHRAAGDPLERDEPFAVARDLLGPPPRDGAPGRPAAEAVWSAVRELSERALKLAAAGPVVLAVDDLHWADESSLRVLAHLARRAEGTRLGLLAAVRPAVPGEDREVVDALAARASVVVSPRALSVAAVAELAADALGAPVDADFATACHGATGGNALLVGELLAGLRERRVRPLAGQMHQIGRIDLERVAVETRRRLRTIAPEGEALARACAVLGDGCPLPTAAKVAGLGATAATQAAAALVAVDVLADEVPLRFRHPVIREAVLAGFRAPELALAHAAAATALAAAGAPPTAVAAHLVRAPASGNPVAVATLRAAARAARASGAPALAAERLRRAVGEPPPVAERAGVLAELGEAELAAGEDAGLADLAAARAASTDPAERARAAASLAAALSVRLRSQEAAELAREALAEGGAEPETAEVLRVLLDESARMDLRVDTSTADARARRTPDHSAAAHAEAARATLTSSPDLSGTWTGVISGLIRASELDDAAGLVERGLTRADARGGAPERAALVGMRGWIALERGDLQSAERDLGAALTAGGAHEGIAAFAAVLAGVVAWAGRVADAQAMLVAHGVAGELPEHQVMNIALFHRARVSAAAGAAVEAVDDLLELGRRYGRWEIERPVPPWRSEAALLLARRRPQEARELARTERRLAVRWGTPLARGLALRAVGVVDDDAGTLARAVDELEATESALELARAELELGACLRRAGRRREARAPLRRAMDAAQARGALALAHRARDELEASGARPRRLALSGTDALTPAERRVALLARAGRTNREIAAELHVAPATVETHLRHVFQKLDLRGRGELGAALPPSG